MDDLRSQVLVIGAGPGGYAAAIRSGQLGLDTIVVDAGPPGGTCLNVGCIPSKALIHAASAFADMTRSASGDTPFGISATAPTIDVSETMAWTARVVARLVDGVSLLLRRAGVRVVHGWAEVLDGKSVRVSTPDGPLRLDTEHLVLATGSDPVELGVLPFGGEVLSSADMFSLEELPKRLVVVGGGYIGLELGTAFAKLGSHVTVVEATDRLLPTFDAELVGPVAQRLGQMGVTVLLGAAATGRSPSGDVRVRTSAGTSVDIAADRVLVAVGRAPRTDGWGLEGLDLDRNGPFVSVDNTCRTSMHGVYAVGDLTGEPMLAHRAISQGELVAEVIAGHRRLWDKVQIPSLVYTDPEIVSVGLCPGDATADGHDLIVGRFPFSANGRALTTNDTAGFVRAVARADNHLLVGLQAVGAHATSELASAFGLALEMGARLEDIAGTIHAHPTRGEALQEAAMGALGHAIHL